MKTSFYKFKISDLIDTYQKRIRERSDKTDYTTAIYEPKGQKKLPGYDFGRVLYINLDQLVSSLIQRHNLKNGFVICASDHTTSAIYVNHFEPGIMEDLNKYLSAEFPHNPAKYKHNIWDNVFKNADGHLKSMMMGKSATVLVTEGKLHLGKFEDIIYAEFDYRPDKTFTIALFDGESNEA